MGLPAKTLHACHCCATGVDHCPHCHDVPIHSVTRFGFVSVVEGIPVYWGDDQAAALDAAQRGAGYVTLSPILADFRNLAGPDFRPVLATPFGDAPIPLDAVRSQRKAEGSGWAFAQSVSAGVAQSDGAGGVAFSLVSLGLPDPPETVPGSTESVQHAESTPEATLRRVMP